MFQVHLERPTTGQIFELVPLGDIQVSKSKNEPASLSATFLRDKMTVETGDIVAVQLDERGMDDFNLFYGYVYHTDKSKDEVKITAYDQLYALKQSTEIKVYGTKTASDLYKQIIQEHKLYMLDPPIITDTGYPIPDIIADNTSLLDLMTECLNKTFNATGRRYFMYDFFKNLCMGEARAFRLSKEQYEFNLENIKDYHYVTDITDRKNEIIVKSESENNPTLAVKRNQQQIDRYGAITQTETVKEGENAQAVANSLYAESMKTPVKLSLSIYGCNPQVIPGRLVHVDFYSVHKYEYICGWYIVDDVTYTLSEGSGDMDVNLTILEVEEPWK